MAQHGYGHHGPSAKGESRASGRAHGARDNVRRTCGTGADDPRRRPRGGPRTGGRHPALHRAGPGAGGAAFAAVPPHLVERAPGTEMSEPSFTRPAVWRMVGLSRHAVGAPEGAQAALESAVREAPEGGGEGCPQRIALLAAPAARRLLAPSESMDPTAVERLAVLRGAVLWL